jgi:hypothetical protein
LTIDMSGMMELDISQLPPRITTTLMLRGSQLPPLQWHLNPNRTAKNSLDEALANKELFGVEALADEAQGAAVRALLYVWNGWPDEARLWVPKAPDRERAYIEGLIERQHGRSVESKAYFQATEEHPIYKALAEFAPKAIGDTRSGHLKRLRDVIAFVEQWEPFVFADVYELALEGQLDEGAVQIIRAIQSREFEELFKFYYQAATGREMKKQEAVAHNIPKKRKPAPAPPRRPAAAPQVNKEAGAKLTQAAHKPMLRPGLDIVVVCPHCGTQNITPAEQRGSVQACCKCRASFKVPSKAVAAKK